MTPLSLELPDTLRDGLETLARRHGLSIDEIVAQATAEKLATLRRARRQRQQYDAATRQRAERFLQALRALAHTTPDEPPN